MSISSEFIMDMIGNNTQNAHTACNKKARNGTGRLGSLFALVLLVVQFCGQVQAWGGNSNSNTDYSIYGNSASYDWLYDGSTLSFQVLGCVWGVVYDSEEAGCLEDESEDGTYNWYMMANCRRPQVAYSVYANSGCGSSYFVGSVSCLSIVKKQTAILIELAARHLCSRARNSISWVCGRLCCISLLFRFAILDGWVISQYII